MRGLTGVILLFSSATAALNLVWDRVYDSGDWDYGLGIDIDPGNNIYITGYSERSGGSDYLLLKCDMEGNVVDNFVFDRGYIERAFDLVVSGSDDIYVTGYAEKDDDSDICTIGYDYAGNPQWVRLLNIGPDDKGTDVEFLDHEIFVAGYYHNGTDYDAILIKYDWQGDTVWTSTYDSGEDDKMYAIALGNNCIYLAGQSYNGIDDWRIAIARFDYEGNFLGVCNYNSTSNDIARGMVIDQGNSLYVTGSTGDNIITLKYSYDLNLTWQQTYDSGAFDRGNDICIDLGGNVFVGGYSWNGVNGDYCIVKYSNNGNFILSETYDSNREDEAFAITSDDSGFIFVTGYSLTSEGSNTRTLKCIPGLGINETPTGFDNLNLDIISLTGSQVVFSYSMPDQIPGRMAVYSINGEKVNDFTLPSTQTRIIWDWTDSKGIKVPSGVYFAQMIAGNQSITSKVVLVD